MNTHCKLGLIALTVLLSSCDDTHDHSDHHANSETPKTVAGVWPPILNGMENEQPLQGSALAAAKESVIDAMRAAVLNNPHVIQALGDNYRQFEASLSDAKNDSSASFLFYNYDTNTTIETTLSEDGTVRFDNTAATFYQPAEHKEEIPLAIALARDELVSNGYDLNGLTGTAMLAHPPTSQIVNEAQTFYSERVLYVTFGPGNGEIPDYSALVNLSAETVSNARLIN